MLNMAEQARKRLHLATTQRPRINSWRENKAHKYTHPAFVFVPQRHDLEGRRGLILERAHKLAKVFPNQTPHISSIRRKATLRFQCSRCYLSSDKYEAVMIALGS